jgi:hypothetical protein
MPISRKLMALLTKYNGPLLFAAKKWPGKAFV